MNAAEIEDQKLFDAALRAYLAHCERTGQVPDCPSSYESSVDQEQGAVTLRNMHGDLFEYAAKQ